MHFYQMEGSQYSQVFPSKKAFLSIEDLVRLRKLCILKLTSIFEMHCPSRDLDIVSPLRSGLLIRLWKRSVLLMMLMVVFGDDYDDGS